MAKTYNYDEADELYESVYSKKAPRVEHMNDCSNCPAAKIIFGKGDPYQTNCPVAKEARARADAAEAVVSEYGETGYTQYIDDRLDHL